MIDSPILMLDHKSKVIIPVNNNLFLISQFNSEKTLNRKYKGNHLLHSSGKITELISVRVLGVYGEKFWERLFNFLNSTKSIAVTQKEVKFNPHELAKIVVQYLKNDSESPDPYLPQPRAIDEIENELRSAFSVEFIYSCLHVPTIEDCLDVMV